MASLLSKFRIDYSDLKVIPDITRKPQESTKQFFDSLIGEFTRDKEGEEDSGTDALHLPYRMSLPQASL